MEWSKKIGSVAGIPIKIHMTMLIFAAWMLLSGTNQKDKAVSELLSLIIIFGSVCLHELGHALMAKKLGIRTRDITLYPFGGIASLIDRINPKQEFLITLAGPLVNVVIASTLIALLGVEKIIDPDFAATALGSLFGVNTALAIFNLLPAFPMDGGRILRSCLQLLKIKAATKIATRCSQTICLCLAALSLIYLHPVLFVISVFIFYNASKELVFSDLQGNSAGLTASQVMVPLINMLQLSPSLTLEGAARTALRSLQTSFPVSIESRILGLVDRETILQRACSSPDPQYITEIMQRDLPCCDSTTDLSGLILAFEQSQSPALIVGSQNDCLGFVFREQLNDLLIVNEMVRQNLAHRELERELGSP